MAEGVKALWSRAYIDKNRVGIFGTSYGGYTSVMEIVRHPEVFAAASSSSPPTDWRNYDTIYTERYMWIPQENKQGYDKGSAMTYADSLRGRLMLYYGTMDNNVHPTNMMQLIAALQRAGKSFDVQVGPDQGHSGLNQQRMMEFFIENLVLTPGGPEGVSARMFSGEQVAEVLDELRITHVVTVPDSTIGQWQSAIERRERTRLVRVCREGEAWEVAAGLHLAGAAPLVMIQCTGLFESGDAIRNVLHDWKLPIFSIIGYRSYLNQDTLPGDTCLVFTEPVLDAWKVDYRLHHPPRSDRR